MLLRMREDDIRIFLQDLSKRRADDDTVITELESVHSELVRSNLAVPPPLVELQDLAKLNMEALERARSNPPSSMDDLPQPLSIPDHLQLRNGHTTTTSELHNR